VLGFVFGATGMLMNHRAVLKIPVDKAVQTHAQLALPDPAEQRFADADQMARWLEAELAFTGRQSRIKSEPPRRVSWSEREIEQPARWSFNWQSPHKSVNAEYFVGNRFVKIETQDATPLGTLMRLHTASGASAFWVLLSDSIAGALVVLSASGLLLWTRMHSVRLSGVALVLGASLGGLGFVF
jgi:hypothetical protein